MNNPIEITLVLFWAGFIGLNLWLMLASPSDATDAATAAKAANAASAVSLPDGERA